MKETLLADADDLALDNDWGDLELDTDNGPQSVLFTRGGRSKLRDVRAFSNENGKPNFRERANMSDAAAPTTFGQGISQRSMSSVDSSRSNSSKRRGMGGLSLLGLGPRGKSSITVEPIDTPDASLRSPRHSMFSRSRTAGAMSALSKSVITSAPNSARVSKQQGQSEPSISPVSSAGAPSSEKYDSSNSFFESGLTRSGSNTSSRGQHDSKGTQSMSRSGSTNVSLTRTGGTKWYRDIVAVHTNALRVELADLESIVGHMLMCPGLLSDRDVKLLYQWFKTTRSLTEQVLHILISAIAKQWLSASTDLEVSLCGARDEIMQAFDEIDIFKAAFLDPDRENVLDELQVLTGEVIMSIRSLIQLAEVDIADAIRFHMSAEDVEECDEIVRSCISQGEFVKGGIYVSFLLRWMRNGEDTVWFERVSGKGRMEKAKASIAKSNFEKYHAFIPGRFQNKYGSSITAL